MQSVLSYKYQIMTLISKFLSTVRNFCDLIFFNSSVESNSVKIRVFIQALKISTTVGDWDENQDNIVLRQS